MVVNDDLCWTCAFPRQPDLAAHQQVIADQHPAFVAKTASPSR
jgi:hypothetical protein